MVELNCKANMVAPEIPTKSPRLSNKLNVVIPSHLRISRIRSPVVSSSSSACSAYEHYLRLPELRKLWQTRDFPGWKNEPVLKPALQALEITFRFVSIALSDPRPYANTREWKRRLESLATSQIELIAMLIEDENDDDDETRGGAPIVDLRSSTGLLAREDSSAEVWKVPGGGGGEDIVNRSSEASLLPRLAAWQKSEDVAEKILYSVECEMRNCCYSLGLGEPNLAGKPNLDYDAVCKPNEIYALRKPPYEIENHENQTLYTTHQILESWIQTAHELLNRIVERIDGRDFRKASSDCYLLERIWKLLAEIEDLHLLMDPDDFLHLKSQLQIKSVKETEAFCFRSTGLVQITKLSKELKHKTPFILSVEVDPKGGSRIQDAAMKLYGEKIEPEKIHLVQALQAIEAALKRFFFAYKQVLAVAMGSLEAKANRVVASSDSSDSLSQIFLEPTYYPSLDAAKTFLGEFWSKNGRRGSK